MYIQKNNYQPPEIKLFNCSIFNGGLNNRDGYIELEDNESPDMLNVDFWTESGLVQKRKGYIKRDDVQTDVVKFLGTYKPFGDTNKEVKITDTNVYIDGVSVLTTTKAARGANYNGMYLIIDGTSIYVYGKFSALVASTFIAITGIAGTYDLLKVVAPNAGYTPLDNTYKLGVTRYDFTAKTVVYEPCTNEMSADYLGSNVLPNAPKYMIVKDSQVFLAGDSSHPNVVYISYYSSPFYFPQLGQITSDVTNDAIVGLNTFGDALVMGTQNNVYALYGQTAQASSSKVFTKKRINTHAGFKNNDSVCVVNNYLFYLGSDNNFYALSITQASETALSTSWLNKKVDLKAKPLNFTEADISSAMAVYYRDLYIVSMGSKILLYSYLLKAWCVWDGLNAKCFMIQDDTLYFGGDAGYVYQYGVGYNDDGKAIVAYYMSKRFHMGYAAQIKKFKSAYVVTHTFDDYDSILTIHFEIDYAQKDKTFNIKDMIARWGKAVFGDRLINKNINRSFPFNINSRGRLISFIFGNDILDQSFKVYEVNGQYEVRGFR